MTEYGVQTNNIFDLLNAADEGRSTQAAKPKPRKKQGGAQSGAKKDQGGAKPSGQRPASSQARATTVTVSGGRGSGRSPQAAPAAGTTPAAGGRGNAGRSAGPAQGARPQSQQRPALARGTEEFVRRHDDSHVSFAEEKGKPAGRNEGAPATKHNAPNHGRQFDRHSGTGRSPVENKKGGAGQGNWGGAPDDELAAVEDVKAELAEAEAAKTENKNKKKKKKKGKKPEEEEEKEKKDEIPDEQLKTLEDFLTERASKAAKLSLPPPRGAGEGVKVDPKWAEAVKREAQDEVFVKVKEEPKKEAPASDAEGQKPSKSALRKKRKKEAKQAAAKKLAEENITNMFDFSAKKEDFPRGGGRREGGRGPRRDGPPREGGQRGPREGGQREGGQRGPREGGQRGPRGNGSGRNNNVQPRRYKVDSDNAGPQFDDSAFPALQVGPPPITGN